MKRVAIGSLFAMAALTGCEEMPPAGPGTSAPANSAARPAAAAPAPAAPLPATAAQATAAPAATTPPPDREKAEVGVGVKGRGYGGGMITEPIHQYFRAQEAIAFNIQIPNAMKLYQAEHNRYPRDMAEYTREILEPNGVNLPKLPGGDRYIYEPSTGELMVEHSVNGPGATGNAQ